MSCDVSFAPWMPAICATERTSPCVARHERRRVLQEPIARSASCVLRAEAEAAAHLLHEISGNEPERFLPDVYTRRGPRYPLQDPFRWMISRGCRQRQSQQQRRRLLLPRACVDDLPPTSTMDAVPAPSKCVSWPSAAGGSPTGRSPGREKMSATCSMRGAASTLWVIVTLYAVCSFPCSLSPCVPAARRCCVETKERLLVQARATCERSCLTSIFARGVDRALLLRAARARNEGFDCNLCGINRSQLSRADQT